jgi:integrase
VLVGTGMRFGEMAGLHQHRIHFDDQVIDVHETWDGERIKAYPKGRLKRRVPMPSWVAEALEQTMQPRDACGLPHAAATRAAPASPCSARTAPRSTPATCCAGTGRSAVELAGLEHARQHDLRHSFASWLVQAGRPLHEIAEVLGQTDASVSRRYAHLANTHLDAVRAVLEGGRRPETSATFVPPDLAAISPGSEPSRPRFGWAILGSNQ